MFKARFTSTCKDAPGRNAAEVLKMRTEAATCSRLSVGWLAFWLVFAARIGLCGFFARSTPELSPPDARAAAFLPRSPALPTRNMQDVRLGDRLAGRNPVRDEVDESLPGQGTGFLPGEPFPGM